MDGWDVTLWAADNLIWPCDLRDELVVVRDWWLGLQLGCGNVVKAETVALGKGFRVSMQRAGLANG